MLLIRRLWLAPAFLITFILYYLYYHAGRGEDIHYNKGHNIFLNPKDYIPKYPITSHVALPSDDAKSLPKIQHDFSSTSETDDAKKTRLERLAAVKESFEHAWAGYKKGAWGKDEVTPLSGNWRNSFGGWGATLVDTMDTLWIMGMEKDFEECVEAVKEIDFTTNTETHLNVFETTIRYLGGLLSAHDLSNGKYPALLDKAKELGDILYMAFDTPNHMPVARWEWARTAMGLQLGAASSSTLIAELGSLSLEFTRLSQLTGDPKWYDLIQRIALLMKDHQDGTKLPGLWPTIIDAKDLKFDYNHFTFGGMADSAYEYLPKQYMLLGGLDENYKTMYNKAIEVAKKKLFFRPLTPTNADILFSANAGLDESKEMSTELQGQHLACFVGGMLGVAAQIFSQPDDLKVARKIVDGCIWAYDSTPSGLMPEVLYLAHCHVGVTPDPRSGVDVGRGDCNWDDDKYYKEVARKQPTKDKKEGPALAEAGKWWVKELSLSPPYTEYPDNRYILRPEAIESIFILYRITGDTSLLDSAWKMFQSIEKATRTQVAHAGVWDVRRPTPLKMDRMESFWLAETLKYFYLIFADPSLISLDEYVLNTEAHPFKRPTAGQKLS